MNPRRFLLLLALLAGTPALRAALFDWPTENRALLEGRPQDFYMYVDRDFEGVKSQPWEGGSFGFVRGPQRRGDSIIYTSLHEGIDIAPVRRDAAGNPLDDIRASAAGTVVHCSDTPGASNYGRYIVIEHDIEGGKIYTLYAHLSSISVTPGQTVAQGETIGRMGYTGHGLNRERAHLHFEIAMRLGGDFASWHAKHFTEPNKHGEFNGLNLAGIEPASILLASAKDPGFRLTDHIRSLPPFYKITIPASRGFVLLRNNPWLLGNGQTARAAAWTVGFTDTGAPVSAVPATDRPAVPELEWVDKTPVAYHHATRGILAGPAGSPRLSDSGHRFLELLLGAN